MSIRCNDAQSVVGHRPLRLAGCPDDQCVRLVEHFEIGTTPRAKYCTAHFLPDHLRKAVDPLTAISICIRTTSSTICRAENLCPHAVDTSAILCWQAAPSLPLASLLTALSFLHHGRRISTSIMRTTWRGSITMGSHFEAHRLQSPSVEATAFTADIPCPAGRTGGGGLTQV
jgi:hypothetical protein